MMLLLNLRFWLSQKQKLGLFSMVKVHNEKYLLCKSYRLLISKFLKIVWFWAFPHLLRESVPCIILTVASM